MNDGRIQNPSNPFGIVPLSNFVPRGFGFVHHSIAILYHEVPNPNLTIRNFFVAVRGSLGAAEQPLPTSAELVADQSRQLGVDLLGPLSVTHVQYRGHPTRAPGDERLVAVLQVMNKHPRGGSAAEGSLAERFGEADVQALGRLIQHCRGSLSAAATHHQLQTLHSSVRTKIQQAEGVLEAMRCVTANLVPACVLHTLQEQAGAMTGECEPYPGVCEPYPCMFTLPRCVLTLPRCVLTLPRCVLTLPRREPGACVPV